MGLNYVTAIKGHLSMDEIREAAPSVFNIQKHESRTDRYKVVPTIDVVDLLIADEFEVVLAGQQRCRIKDKLPFTRHVLRLRKKGARSMNGCFPEVVLTNSHDGSSSYRLLFGLYRSQCGTQLTVGDTTVASQKVRHTGDAPEVVVKAANDVLSKVPMLETAMAEWQSLELTSTDLNMFARQALKLNYGNRTSPVTEDEILRSRDFSDTGSNLWAAYLRVQKNITQGGIQYARTGGKHSKGKTRGIKGIHRNLQFNRALWDLAQSTFNAHQPQDAE